MTPERSEKLLRVLNHRQDNLTVLMENVQDPHNISAVMRTCESVGIQDIYILNTRMPRHEKFGHRSSSSSAKWLTVHQFDDVQACFAELRAKYDKIFTTHLSSDAVSLYDMDFTGKMVLVFGNEHSGVSEEVRAQADGNFIIPQVGIIRSLNISVACAVTIYEAYRQKKLAGHYNQSSLPQQRIQTLMTDWGFKEADMDIEPNETHRGDIG
jgi:tRNA (guanosine-2'-O-)-methyltransferase